MRMSPTRFVVAGALFTATALIASGPIGARALQHPGDEFLGTWMIEMNMRGNTINAALTILRTEDGELAGSWSSDRGSSDLHDVKYEDGKLTFQRTLSTPRGEMSIDHEARIKNDKIEGSMKTPRGSIPFSGTRDET